MNRLFIEAEIKELERILSGIPEDNLIEQMTFQGRLEAVRQELEKLALNKMTEKSRLTFKGPFVNGIKGINAEFAGESTKLFTALFSSIKASLEGALNNVGPIPNKTKDGLMITNIAVGSFGFEFEVPKNVLKDVQPDLFGKESISLEEKAMEKTTSLLSIAQNGEDDDIAEFIEEIEPRVLKKAEEFLSFMQKKEMLFSLGFKKKKVDFKNSGDIDLAILKLKSDKLVEIEDTLTGIFQGFLPDKRTFEIKVGTETLSGKISPSLDASLFFPSKIHQRVRFFCKVRQFGDGKKKYTVIGIGEDK